MQSSCGILLCADREAERGFKGLTQSDQSMLSISYVRLCVYIYTKVRCIEPPVADFLIGVWIISIHWPDRTTERTRSKCYWDLGFSSWDLENSHLESKTLLRGCSDISKRWSSEGASTPSLDSWVPKWETAIQRKDRDMLRPIGCVHSWSMSTFGQIWTSARSTRCIWDWRGFFIG